MAINTISLVSNSSMHYYPNNTTSSFTCQFPEELDYSDGDYEISLAAFLYPKSYYSFREDALHNVKLRYFHSNEGSGQRLYRSIMEDYLGLHTLSMTDGKRTRGLFQAHMQT